MDGQGVALSAPKRIRWDNILVAMIAVSKQAKADLVGGCQEWRYAEPRQALMYLTREHTKLSYPLIGRLCGNRDHTTVLIAYRKVEAILARDEASWTVREQRIMTFVREVQVRLFPQNSAAAEVAIKPVSVAIEA